MAEVGNMGLPPKVLKKGITDMVRISDPRTSARSGPLAVVLDGDMIEIVGPARRIHFDIPDEELARRLAAWVAPVQRPESGFVQPYHGHVDGADTGADLGFLKGCRGRAVGRDSH